MQQHDKPRQYLKLANALGAYGLRDVEWACANRAQFLCLIKLTNGHCATVCDSVRLDRRFVQIVCIVAGASLLAHLIPSNLPTEIIHDACINCVCVCVHELCVSALIAHSFALAHRQRET